MIRQMWGVKREMEPRKDAVDSRSHSDWSLRMLHRAERNNAYPIVDADADVGSGSGFDVDVDASLRAINDHGNRPSSLVASMENQDERKPSATDNENDEDDIDGLALCL